MSVEEAVYLPGGFLWCKVVVVLVVFLGFEISIFGIFRSILFALSLTLIVVYIGFHFF